MITTTNATIELMRRPDLTHSDRVRAYSPVDSLDHELVELFDQLREVIQAGPDLTDKIVVFDLREFDFQTVNHDEVRMRLGDLRYEELSPCIVLAPKSQHDLFDFPSFHPVSDADGLYNWLCARQVKKRQTTPVPLMSMTPEEI